MRLNRRREEIYRHRTRASAADASPTPSAIVAPKNTTPYGARTTIAVITGWTGGSASLAIQAAAAAPAADAHSFATYRAGSPVRPMRAFSFARSSSISAQPAIPADAVSPAAPHSAGTPNAIGNGTANRYPSTVVSATRTSA